MHMTLQCVARTRMKFRRGSFWWKLWFYISRINSQTLYIDFLFTFRPQPTHAAWAQQDTDMTPIALGGEVRIDMKRSNIRNKRFFILLFPQFWGKKMLKIGIWLFVTNPCVRKSGQRIWKDLKIQLTWRKLYIICHNFCTGKYKHCIHSMVGSR